MRFHSRDPENGVGSVGLGQNIAAVKIIDRVEETEVLDFDYV